MLRIFYGLAIILLVPDHVSNLDAVETSSTTEGPKYWPRPDSLLLFAPLDGEYRLDDMITGRMPKLHDNLGLLRSEIGPYGQPNTSYTVSKTGFLCEFDHLPQFSSFTLALYFLTPCNDSGGILAIEGQYTFPHRLSLVYKNRNLEIHRYNYEGQFSSNFASTASLSSNVWTFIGITYDRIKRRLILYNDKGQAIFLRDNFDVLDNSNVRLFLAYARDGNTFHLMKPSDAMACVMLYDSVLTNEEMAQLPSVCKLKGRKGTFDQLNTAAKFIPNFLNIFLNICLLFFCQL